MWLKSNCMSNLSPEASPHWSWTTKLVVGLSFAAILIGLILRFRTLVGPILIAFIVTFLIQPIASYVYRRLHISWRLAVTLIYLILILVLLGILTASGLAVIDQTQSLIKLVSNAVDAMPQTINQLSTQVYRLGPFVLDMSHLDLNSISNQILNYVQPLLGKMGDLVATIATSAATFIGWIAFVILISYFMTSETRGLPTEFKPNIPGYSYDIHRMTRALGNIWNIFLRGQLILYLLSSVTYFIMLTILGVRYSYVLAFLGAFARFLPYIGPAIVWTTFVLVSFFQGYTLFGMNPFAYSGLVLGLTMLADSAFDNIISPNLMGSRLKVHPAAVLVSALILLNLIGLIGVLLAAPVLATLKLVARYALRKMLDQDPWEGVEDTSPPPIQSFIPESVRARVRLWREMIVKRPGFQQSKRN